MLVKNDTLSQKDLISITFYRYTSYILPWGSLERAFKVFLFPLEVSPSATSSALRALSILRVVIIQEIQAPCVTE